MTAAGPTRCDDCGDLWGHVSAPHAVACARDAAEVREIVALASDLDRPAPLGARDLWAHLRTRLGAEGRLAVEATRVVLELGWRPVLGQYASDAALLDERSPS